MTARVLVVDDLVTNLKLLEAKLTSEYYDVVLAKSGIEALEVLEHDQNFDVILLDVMMPGMDGFETCQKIKAIQNIEHIPVVMVTALSDIEDRIKGLKSGADDFLTKPINEVALFARIRSLVRLKTLTDELRMRDKTSHEFGVTTSMYDAHHEVISGARIAIVDDDAAQSARISSKLSGLGAFIEVFDNTNAAADAILKGNFDLIVASTQIAGTDTLRFATHIRSNVDLRNIPILILVEDQDKTLLAKALDLGINDYIIAPIDENELTARVNTQVRRKKFQDALKANYQKSVTLATTDGLTGMYNRHYFDSHFRALFQQANIEKRPLSVMIIDIDFFKPINDTYGHLAGDALLRQVPGRVVQNVRATDLVARYGGEEFVVIMANTDLRDGFMVADRVRKAMEEKEFIIPQEEAQTAIKKTVSVGVTSLKKTDTPETFLGRADKALYQAKETGRNKVVWMY